MTRMQELFNDNNRDEAQVMKNEEYAFMANIADSYASILEKMIVFSRVKNEIVKPLMQKSLSSIKDDELKIKIFGLARKANSRLTNIQGNSEHFADDIGNLDK